MSESGNFRHVSVLLNETIEGLNIRPDGIYVDGTMGGAGHGSEICRRLSGRGRYIGIDQDADAIQAATERLKEFESRVTIVRSNYERFPEILAELEIPKVDGVLLDLGVSSYQLDTPERGFSYREDAPLDMRMDQRESLTAADIVNGYSEKELARLIYDYGEDPAARSIARHIVRHREKKPITTTLELADIVRESVPPKVRMTGGHPAKRTFQAIRIACNRELEVLENTLGSMIEALTPGGRIAVITFHSLEDRIVKNAFKTAENPCICPPDFPVCVCGRKSKGRVVTRKPILPSEEELAVNSRSSSAKLRIFERGEEN
ncbi:MAG: 16S rRNA (cytosine(1402)-N(4))-methyltransferase RsmH [Lachnospiraceae bacterium]|nr:16S rRNA (cytosine(1402)-N(4))-methyltransferase RsmH [Lachnospiraceae bacterium]